MNVDDRHRGLLVAALHSHAESLDREYDMAVAGVGAPGVSLETATRRSSERNRIVRERSDALDLARDIECGR